MAVSASAQNAVAPAVDPYDDLEAAMDETMGTDQTFEKVYQKFMGEFRQDPRLQELERFSPGVIRDVGQAMKPWIKKYTDRLEKRFRPQSMQLLHEAYTPEEAVKLAAYYRTNDGKIHLMKVALADDTASLRPRSKSASQAEPAPQPKSFLTPAAGHNPTPRAAPAQSAPQVAPHPDALAYHEDDELQQKEWIYFRSAEVLWRRISALEMDKDIQNGMREAMDYAASSHSVRVYDRPLS